MKPIKRPSERLLNVTLDGGWKVVEEYKPKVDEVKKLTTPCYIVKNGDQNGFLKAYDYSDILKSGGQFKRMSHIIERERSILRKCKESGINSVINLLAEGRYSFKPDSVDELVEYYILEYSEDGDLIDCIKTETLLEFENKFEALMYVFDGLHQLHNKGIMHLDIKAENIIHFVKLRLTKIADFGAARQLIVDVDNDLLDELNSIRTTRTFAPPECLYNDFEDMDWKLIRRKIDLFLAGNLIVRVFTGFSFTTLLKETVSDAYDWNNEVNKSKGKMFHFMPHLIDGASKVYVEINKKIKEINKSCGTPLTHEQISDLMKIIKELCCPDPSKRGHPKELQRNNDLEGLDRYRDRLRTFKNSCAGISAQK